jgi:hypothetical protein
MNYEEQDEDLRENIAMVRINNKKHFQANKIIYPFTPLSKTFPCQFSHITPESPQLVDFSRQIESLATSDART